MKQRCSVLAQFAAIIFLLLSIPCKVQGRNMAQLYCSLSSFHHEKFLQQDVASNWCCKPALTVVDEVNLLTSHYSDLIVSLACRKNLKLALVSCLKPWKDT